MFWPTPDCTVTLNEVDRFLYSVEIDKRVFSTFCLNPQLNCTTDVRDRARFYYSLLTNVSSEKVRTNWLQHGVFLIQGLYNLSVSLIMLQPLLMTVTRE